MIYLAASPFLEYRTCTNPLLAGRKNEYGHQLHSVAVRFLRDPIRYRPVKELAPARLFVAWPREPESAEVASFVRAAKKVAGTEMQVETDSGKRRELSGTESSFLNRRDADAAKERSAS